MIYGKTKRRYLHFILIAIIFYTVAFLWEELPHFSFHQKINDQKVTNYLTPLAFLLTAGSLYYIFKQTKEMEKARITSTLPQIYPNYIDFYLHEAEDSNGGAPQLKCFSSQSSIDRHIMVSLADESVIKKEKLKPAEIIIENVGLGVALNFQASWIFNRDELEAATHAAYHDRIYYGGRFDFNFVKPQCSASSFVLPYGYLHCIGSLSTPAEIAYDYVLDLPKLELHISYNDIQGKLYQGSFNVNLLKLPSTMNTYRIEFRTKHSQQELKLKILKIPWQDRYRTPIRAVRYHRLRLLRLIRSIYRHEPPASS